MLKKQRIVIINYILSRFYIKMIFRLSQVSIYSSILYQISELYYQFLFIQILVYLFRLINFTYLVYQHCLINFYC